MQALLESEEKIGDIVYKSPPADVPQTVGTGGTSRSSWNQSMIRPSSYLARDEHDHLRWASFGIGIQEDSKGWWRVHEQASSAQM